MQTEGGDEYVRRIAAFIRANESSLAELSFIRRRRSQQRQTSSINPLAWLPTTVTPKPVVLSIDTHHLFYLFIRLEALNLPVGSLDVRVDSPSRPLSYINVFPGSDKTDTLSLASFRSSLSVVSTLSLGVGWWGRPEPPGVDTDLKYIYSSFTKLPALSIVAPGRKVITELADEPPNENAIPMDSFKNLQSLECTDIDPRSLLGWDLLAESLISLKVKRSGLEDVSDIFIGAVLDDQARREGSNSRKRMGRTPRQGSFYTTQLPESVPEAADEDYPDRPSTSSPTIQLSSRKWASLRFLSLSDNALTFLPSEIMPHLTSITHLDLSSNLLNSVPEGLSALFNLTSLNLSDNMIESVLGIYLTLGQVLYLNLSRNRLESICGLERLHALERVDLRHNVIEESAEIGRLATLPNITEIWVQGNPFVEFEDGYRITCFDFFWKEGKTIMLDGSPPGFYEKRNLTIPPPEQMSSARPVSAAYSPPIIAVGHSHPHSHHDSPLLDEVEKQSLPSTSSHASPQIAPVGAVGVGGKARRKKPKRIVDLDGENSDGSVKSSSQKRTTANGSGKSKAKSKTKALAERETSPRREETSWGQVGTMLAQSDFAGEAQEQPDASTSTSELPRGDAKPGTVSRARKSRHTRSHTELSPSESFIAPASPSIPPIPSFRRARDSQLSLSARSSARRARVTASVYELPASDLGDDGTVDEAEAFRRRIEALKKDMGDGWLKVFSQSQMKAPS